MLEKRFKSKFVVDLKTGCWLWQACYDKDGYGIFRVSGKNVRAPRYSYEQSVGPIPEDLQIDHYRMNPGPRNAPCSKACVNPAHLEVVTCQTNILRGEGRAAVNAKKTHCSAGHAYTKRNTYIDPSGKRQCRECHRRRVTEYYARQHPQAGLHNKLKTHCKWGHEYTEENTYIRSNGSRECRECKQQREHERYHQNKKTNSLGQKEISIDPERQ